MTYAQLLREIRRAQEWERQLRTAERYTASPLPMSDTVRKDYTETALAFAELLSKEVIFE